MRASALFLFAAAGFAAAQTTDTEADSSTGAISGCGSQIDLIIKTCLGTTQLQLEACTANDWDCLCTQSINVLTCYNNCMSSPDRFGQEQIKVANCNAASAYGTSSTATHTSTSTVTSSATAAAATSGTATVSASGSALPENTGAAVANGALPAGGLLAAVFGLAALL